MISFGIEDDFCVEHGRDFMKTDRGPIPYCAKCDEESAKDTAAKSNTDHEVKT